MIQPKNERMSVAELVQPGTVAEAALGEGGFAVYPASQRETKFPPEGTVVVLSGHTSSNDDGGNSYDRSNYQVIQRDYGDHPDVEFGEYVQLRGESEDKGLIEMISALASYPLLDDAHHSEMEFDEQNEAIDDDLAEGLARIIKARYWHEIDDEDLNVLVDDAIDALLDHGVIAANFRALADRSNVEWDGASIDVKKIADRSGTLHRLLVPWTYGWSWLSWLADSIQRRMEIIATIPPGALSERRTVPLLNVLYDQGYAQESEATGYGDAAAAASAMQRAGLDMETVDAVAARLAASAQAEAEFAKAARDAWKVAALRELIEQVESEETDADGDDEFLRAVAEAVPQMVEIAERYEEKPDEPSSE